MTDDEYKKDGTGADSESRSLDLRILLLAGLAVYVTVSVLVGIFVPDIATIEDDEWIGADLDDVLFHHGHPKEVADDGEGGNVLMYEQVRVTDSAYDVERIWFSITADGQIYAVNREP